MNVDRQSRDFTKNNLVGDTWWDSLGVEFVASCTEGIALGQGNWEWEARVIGNGRPEWHEGDC